MVYIFFPFPIELNMAGPALAEVKSTEFLGLMGKVGFQPKNRNETFIATKPYDPCQIALMADFCAVNVPSEMMEVLQSE